MNKLIVTKSGVENVSLTNEEKEQIELDKLNNSLAQNEENVQNAEFEIKLITKLMEWGVI